jgi:hypothetical protein
MAGHRAVATGCVVRWGRVGLGGAGRAAGVTRWPPAALPPAWTTSPADDPQAPHPYPRVVVVELRGPVEEVSAVQAWIAARALYSDATISGVFGDKVSCRMNVVVGEE